MPEESFQERTEQATPRRREEARQKGQVARSNELSAVAILLSGLLGLSLLGPYMYAHLRTFTVELLTDGFAIQLDTQSVRPYLLRWGASYAQIAAPLIALLAFVALAVNYAQVGVVFTGEPLLPKLSRISPLSGFQRLFSSHGLMELAKGLFKIGVVGYVTYLTVAAEAPQLVNLADMGVGQIFVLSGGMVLKLGYRIAFLLLVMAVLDYGFQRWDYERNLRMTHQEIREELKQQEGDPLIRARVRSLQREMSRRRMMSEVPKANVVVTNPTHIAVALRYDPAEMSAPVVVAKGQRLVAEKIKEMARQHGVPLVENKPLAQALFKAVHLGAEIPEELFRAVAEVLAFVFQLRQSR